MLVGGLHRHDCLLRDKLTNLAVAHPTECDCQKRKSARLECIAGNLRSRGPA